MAKVQGKKSAASKKAPAKPAARAKSARSAKPAPKTEASCEGRKGRGESQGSGPEECEEEGGSETGLEAESDGEGGCPGEGDQATKPVAKSATAPAAKTPEGREGEGLPAQDGRESHPGAAAATAAATVARVAPKAEPEKKRRRSRPRVSSSGPATASWFSQGENKATPLVLHRGSAACRGTVSRGCLPRRRPTASSPNDELTAFAVRTAPVRIDVEAMAAASCSTSPGGRRPPRR